MERSLLVLAAALVVVIAGLRYASDLLGSLLLAGTLVIAMEPLVQRLAARGISRSKAIVTLTLMLVLLTILLASIFSIELQRLVHRIPFYQDMLGQRLSGLQTFLASRGLELGTIEAKAYLQKLIGFIASFFSRGFAVLLFLFIILVLSLDYGSMGASLSRRIPQTSPLVGEFRKYTREIQTQYGIQTVSNAISSLAFTLEFALFRIDFALLWGILSFFLAYIPQFGLILASIPPVLLAFVQYGPLTALLVFVFAVILNGLMDNFVTPRFTGKGLQLRFSTVILSAIFWIWVFGPLGALLSLPLTLLLRAILESQESTRLWAYFMSTPDYSGPNRLE